MHPAYRKITDLELAHDGVLLVKAICQHCRKTVMHGAGFDPGDVILGVRVAPAGAATTCSRGEKPRSPARTGPHLPGGAFLYVAREMTSGATSS
jgi:hypothetical protein